MTNIDLTPLYRNGVGFDHFASLLDKSLRNDSGQNGYPPYNIELCDENHYEITIAVAGFKEEEISITTENGVLKISGDQSQDSDSKRYLHKGIAARRFERKFNLADHVEVTDARLDHGMLNISLVREIPEAMKPRTININTGSSDKQRTIANEAA